MNTNTRIDSTFAGSIPQLYQHYLVPLIFEPYAADMAARVVRLHPAHVLEIAAGTGVVTRHLSHSLPAATTIVATDLNQAMLDQAAAQGTSRPVEWKQADAIQLPFEDASFDVVVCQFGVMFFPDKAKAFSEARRVLKPGGTFIFNVWDRIEENEFVHTIQTRLDAIFSDNPSRFMVRTPHGYHDSEAISRDLKNGGFVAPPQIDTLAARSKASAAQHPAIAYCQGTPLRSEIEERAPNRLEEITALVEQTLAQRFGARGVDGKIQANIVAVIR